MKKESEDKTQGIVSFLRFDLLIAFLCGLLILAHFLSSFFPKSRLWGTNHLAYFPLWVRLIFTILGLSILVPWVNSRVYKLLEQILSFFQRILPKRKVLTASVLAVISMFFFWLLRTKSHFLGDGYIYISNLESEKYLRIGFEPLEIFTHLYIYKFLKLFFYPSAESVYAGLSVLAGGVFIFILFFLTKNFSEDKVDRLVIFSLLIFSGATQLFLGYVEHYTFTYVSVFAYLYFSIRYLQGKVKIYLPILFCALSTAFHFSSAYLLPSLFFLFALKRKKGELVFSIKRAFPYLLILILLLGLSICYVWSMTPLLFENFVPLLKGRTYAPDYTLFSSYHLLDILNQHLLISPVGAILLLALSLTYKRIIKFKDPIIFFMTIVFISQFLYHLLIDPKLTAFRDWDLFSIVGLGYTLLGVYLFISSIKNKKYYVVVLIFTAFFSVLPWFILNTNSIRAIDRFKNLIDLDLKRSRPGRITLANYYSQQKKFIEAEKVQAEIFKIFPEVSLTREAETYIELGDYDKAKALLKKAIAINPRFVDAYNDLGRIYLKEGKTDEALNIFQNLARSNPLYTGIRVNLGEALLNKGRFEEALAEFKKGLKLGGASKELYNNIAYIYLKLSETEKAIKAYKKALKIDPGFYYAHSGLGQIYLDKYFLDEALVEFDQAVRLKPDYAPAHYNLGFVYSRKGLKEKALEEFELFLKYSSDETKKEEVRGWLLKLRSQKP
jgi:tetratricopeptide (TPR) repeat protein